jgi:hypothetical protein
MKITVNGKLYRVIKLNLDTNSNYNTGIHIFRDGEKLPISGTTCKKTDNVKEIATEMIKQFNAYKI